MEAPSPPRIVFAERLENAVIIVFDNGCTGVYSAALLHSIFSSAEDISNLEGDSQSEC